MRNFRILPISLLTAALLCAGASADQPTTRPENSYSNAQLRRSMRAIAGRTNGVVPPTPQEWDDMMQFMQKYSHSRYYVLDTVPIAHDSPIALEAVRRWRNFVFISQHFPTDTKLRDDLLRRVQLEDDLFELTLRDRADQGSEGIEIQEKIHNKVAEIVQLEFTERQARIDRLEKIVADEKARLQADQANEDQIIDRRTDMIISRLEKRNPNLAPPTTRPQDPSSVDSLPPAESHNALMNLAGPQDSAQK